MFRRVRYDASHSRTAMPRTFCTAAKIIDDVLMNARRAGSRTGAFRSSAFLA
jgi:hypothetical protein